ncbi:hypothetical protein O4H52_08005 [Sphingomonadaceae bacterium G21617-S1]|nr:hypothetical protein [Sphingomonadaceae bacterium G21617-S1]
MLGDSVASESQAQAPGSSGALAIDPVRLIAARRKIAAMGLTVSDWAAREGYSRRLVYKILDGRSKCLYGRGLEIANKLGLRDGPAPIGAING